MPPNTIGSPSNLATANGAGLTPEDFECVDVTVLSKANSLVGAIVDHEITAPPSAAATRMRLAAFVLCACHRREEI